MAEFEKYDIVTGLPYYGDFEKSSKELIATGADKLFALVSTDIGNFKFINHIYGFDKANSLLKSLVEILSDEETGCVLSCRTHSDHIVSLFTYCGRKSDFQDIIDSISTKFVKTNKSKYSSTSLHLNNGIYFFESSEDDFSVSFDKANIARREAKGNYKISSVAFKDDMLGKKENASRVVVMFESAYRSERIEVFLQPKIDITSKKIVGAEALSRIYSEDGEIIPPDTYIPVLENTGKIVDLDRYVMKVVFELVQTWKTMRCTCIPISINLSRMHFYEKKVADKIYKTFSRYNIDPSLIEFELTETLFCSDSETILKEVNKLRAYGFRVSIDDFGVGLSTLGTLAALPIDTIKFDRSFVTSCMQNNKSFEILKGLVGVFKRIDYDVICEGVETAEQEKLVFECGCDVVQGFYYDRPMPIKDFNLKYIS